MLSLVVVLGGFALHLVYRRYDQELGSDNNRYFVEYHSIKNWVILFFYNSLRRLTFVDAKLVLPEQ